MNLNQLVDLNRNRGTTYLFLSKSCEVELTKEQIEEMRKSNGSVLDPNALAEMKNPDIQEGFDLISHAISEMRSREVEDSRINLAADYADVFLGVKHDILPHPSESAYSNMEHLVYQRERSKVANIYRQVGLNKISKFTEPEDHIAIELSFMAYLTKQTADAIEGGKIEDARRYAELQKSFLEDHLMSWTPRLCEDILKASETDFYRGIARIMKGFLSEDVSTVNELISE